MGGVKPGSWRHTPFRNVDPSIDASVNSSWRHTPFRNDCS
ncbi:hypothetical protein J558_0348 [Acinetobacter baumannii 1106579]|nr:hypothetical protein ACINNAV82_2754 [Acinetobacter baumannii Naval-82]EXE20715.1 hypothetical protein J558_0348 [Acinetobacter baumannii 1106579]